MKSPITFVAILLMTVSVFADEPGLPTVNATHRPVEGIGAEVGVMRRDPSDIIKVGELYYVWYSNGKISPGYDATIWYATSKDGYSWTEKSMALSKGEPGSWESASVFTPNILGAKRHYLLLTREQSRDTARSVRERHCFVEGLESDRCPDTTRQATNLPAGPRKWRLDLNSISLYPSLTYGTCLSQSARSGHSFGLCENS